jgi:penicillin-binding protein 1B
MKSWLLFAIGTLLGVAGAVLASALIHLLAIELPSEMRGGASRGPSRIESRPLLLRVGMPLDADALVDQLRGAGYRETAAADVARGEYARRGLRFRIGARPFRDSRGEESGGKIRVELSRDARVVSLSRVDGGALPELRLEGALLGAFYPKSGRDREPVRLDALPRHLVDAVLAIEDRRFFDHPGLDLQRIGGALLTNLRAGRIVEGGSTLTQQLVKNLYLTRERTLWRKLQEVPLALLVEWRMDKSQILEAYLNEVYLGQAGGVAIHGIGAAARHYFGKPAEELSLPESALLAGMLRGPILYAPVRDAELARERRDEVLQRMHEQGRIGDAAFEAASAAPLGVREPWSPPSSTRWAIDLLRRDLEQRFPDVDLARAGWRFETSLDLRLQRLAERAVRAGVAHVEQASSKLRREDSPLQAALVALDPRTGELLALVGGRDYGTSQFDRAREAWRQPGSLFKPVGALAALMPDAGAQPRFTLATLLEDEPFAMDTPDGPWQPANYDRTFRGFVTLREALEQSRNVPMVRLGQAVGPRRIVRVARQLGIESPLHAVPSLVLGTSEVTLLEMTRAFGVLAAGGYRADLRAWVAARGPDGEVVAQQPPAGADAIDPALAHVLTSALRGVVDRGTGAGVRARYRGPLAGKTGTTDDFRDAWFVGYTPDFVAGVWMGFDDGASLRQSAARVAVPLFADFAAAALGVSGGREFATPPGVETFRIVAAPGHPAGLRCPGAPEVFLAGTGPDGFCAPFGFLDSDPLRALGEWLRHGPFAHDPGEAQEAGLPPVGAGPPEARQASEARPGR